MLAELDAWSRAHAVIVLAAAAVVLFTRQALWLSLAASLSFALLFYRCRRRWSPRGAFGAANWLTLLRLALVATLPVWPLTTPGVVLAAVCSTVLALDGLDGWLAQRFGTASEFGAHFDLESDASFVLIAELVLFIRNDAGVWIVTTGLLRYVYVLVVALRPPRGTELRRSRFGRLAFACLVAGLIAAFAFVAPFGSALALLGTIAVSASFARSFHAAYRSPLRPGTANGAGNP